MVLLLYMFIFAKPKNCIHLLFTNIRNLIWYYGVVWSMWQISLNRRRIWRWFLYKFLLFPSIMSFKLNEKSYKYSFAQIFSSYFIVRAENYNLKVWSRLMCWLHYIYRLPKVKCIFWLSGWYDKDRCSSTNTFRYKSWCCAWGKYILIFASSVTHSICLPCYKDESSIFCMLIYSPFLFI